jgi:hypothetical protein
MAKCRLCGGNHSPSYHLEKKIQHGGFPSGQPGYKAAHMAANKAEKAAFPKGYAQMKKIDSGLPKGQDSGNNTSAGKLEVSMKVPKKYRKEVAFHEEVESQKLRKKSGQKNKKVAKANSPISQRGEGPSRGR